ncbi:hypothetical protein M3197_02410 [Sporosarcina aquimarina]|nr:hypothetical protein [Sporosarcina aquimarina]
MLFQIGMFLAAIATAIVAMIALYTNRKKVTIHRKRLSKQGDYS